MIEGSAIPLEKLLSRISIRKTILTLFVERIRYKKMAISSLLAENWLLFLRPPIIAILIIWESL